MPNVLDLFCGCGGFSEGFSLAGYKILFGIDFWSDAINTYQRNFPETLSIVQDITTLNGETILKLISKKAEEIDVVIGGPPCQGFSISGKRMIDDPRNVLYKSFVDIVGDIKPKVFLMENVPGIVRLFDGKVKDQIIQDFENIGYKVAYRILSSEYFGVPQKRKRVFFVGLNTAKMGDLEFEFPYPTRGIEFNLPPVLTCEDAISDLDFISDSEVGLEIIDYKIEAQNEYQVLMREKSYKLLNHVTTLHTKRTKEIISMVPDGGNYKSLPKELWETRKVNIAWTRMNSNKPSFTIDTGHNHHFHYRANRVPTVRESARIQSFPDKFEFVGIKTSQLKQVGNAVPPLLGKALAEKILELI